MERSLLLVHAHPDDESIGTGATMAKYAAEGARVTLVTCTLGEFGEIIPPDLRHLFPDELGQHRIVELDRACRALGVEDHRFLGGEGRYRDSGMMGLPDNDDPNCFWQANVDEAADALAKIIDEVAATAIVTYDANGYYGHPDHIQAHRVTRRAHELASQAAKLYATAMPVSVLAQAVELPEDSWFVKNTDLSVAVPDGQVTTEIDATGYLDAKREAMRAHETQITVDGDYFALSNELGARILGREYYTQLAGPRAARDPEGRYERDLFARLSVACCIMGTSQGPRPGGGQRTVNAAGYVMLFLLGAFQGLIGSFQYSQSPAPLIAIILAVIIFATCVACGWGLGTFAAGLLPAVGWILTSFLLAMPRPNGSVIITATAAGEWYLYGGALACAVGCVGAFFARIRRLAPPR